MALYFNNRRFKQARPIRFIPSKIVLPGFAYSYPEWAGASYAIGLLQANPGFNYAFRLPVQVQSETFVPVIRTNVGLIYTRYKLWTTGTEMIPYPLYAGEEISTDEFPVLEIWNVQGTLTAEMTEEWYLTLGLQSTPESLQDQTAILYPVT